MSREYKDFTIEEANNLIPWLSYQFGEMFMLMQQMDEILAELMRLEVNPSPEMLTPQRKDTPEIRKSKQKLKRLLTGLFDHYSEIQDRDIIIQDVSEGRVSFYTYFGEHPVFLTWQYGESAVSWWHEIYEDADCRKPLRRNHSISIVVN